MSYTINISGMQDSEYMEGEASYTNQTWIALSQDDTSIINLANNYYGSDSKLKYANYIGESDLAMIDDSEVVQWILNQDFFFEIQDNWHPMYNYAHILQGSPDSKDLLHLASHAPNVTILHIEHLESHVIALNGCGMDFSDSVAYAYKVIDRFVPPCFLDIDCAYTISKEAFKVLKGGK